MRKILYLVILIVLCVLLLRFGGYDIDSFKSAIHLRDPSTVLSPITDNIPKGQEIIGGNGGNGGGYEFDPNLKLDGSNGGSNPSNNNNQDSTIIPNNSDNTDNSNTEPNSETDSESSSETVTDSNNNSESESNTENSKEDTTSNDSNNKSEDKSEDKSESTTEKKQNISNKIYKFVVDGKETILSSETAASFAQWLEQNFKEDSDISYSTDDKESKDDMMSNDSNYTFEDGKNLDELISSISTIKSLPNYDDYDRNTFEKPVIKYNLNGKKVNRNDYAWKTSPYFNEADFTYTCPYTGKVFKDTDDKKEDKDFSQLDFDHIIPLKSAYLRGAKDWTPEQQNAYAYDQSIGVDVYNSANRSKSDKGPAEWLPDINKGSYCYSWLVICSKYNLSMTEEEIKICNDEINKAIKNGEKIEFMGGYYNG